ncbi:MAG TPA: cytochrome c [Planctomycetota bacterium]|nr:cytochrome c [Planctomycetota bacterium]
MTISLAWRAFWAAVTAGGLAVGVALASAAVLRHTAGGASHQEPTEERWLEERRSDSPVLLARGRELFLKSCAHCHAADARGDEGPDLHGLQVSDRYIARVITRGVEGEMPAFGKKHGSEDVAALTAYLRSLD